MAKKGKIAPIDDSFAAQQFEILLETLEADQYEQYEISNFAQHQRYAIHNSSYWKRHAYLGVGPSAHSFNGTTRQYNIANNALYIKAIEQDSIPATIETLTPQDQVNDYLLTSLRTIWGCQITLLNHLAALDYYQKIQPFIHDFQQKKWLFIQNNTLQLTPQGKLFADAIASELFWV